MRRKQNVILFSAGESLRNGKLEYIKSWLNRRDICCLDWRELFSTVRDSDQIALLPNLIKKIPTFDFALLLAEGVDELTLRGVSGQKAIRDNVIFELGLCVMALGPNRVILLTDRDTRIPDDLRGIEGSGVEHIVYHSEGELGQSLERVAQVIADQAGRSPALERIASYVGENADSISPVFVGAAVSSAEAYFLNFLLRLLEHWDQGFSPRGEDLSHPFPPQTQIRVIFPREAGGDLKGAISRYYARMGAQEFILRNAGSRPLFFHGIQDPDGSLTILDIPTSVTASYSLVQSILDLAADDDYDQAAEKRFNTKEMDIYECTLKRLLQEENVRKRLALLPREADPQAILEGLGRIRILRETI